jgi:hypothetical protein
LSHLKRSKTFFTAKALSTVMLTALCAFNAMAFDAGEHALIGNTAFVRVMDKSVTLTHPNSIENLEMDVSYSYGQLMAMSGDMYRSIEEIALDDATIMSDFFKRNRGSLKKCVELEIENIRTQKVYGGCDDIRFATKKIRYVSLAHDNYSHFAWHNITKYIEMHGKALWFAKLAHLKCSEEEKKQDKKGCKERNKQLRKIVAQSDYDEKLSRKHRKMPKLFPRKKFSQRYFINMSKPRMVRLAIFANAFADHYLSDAFSAGHLRVPRSQIDSFVLAMEDPEHNKEDQKKTDKEKERGEGSAVSGALTQFLHNNDGAMTGIKVINSPGVKFVIRSDKQSLNQVIHDNIEQKGSIKNAIKSMSQEMQLVFKANTAFGDLDYKQYFSKFIEAIPAMMDDLRKQIALESQKSEIKSRIPPKLLAALKKLN